MDNQSTATLPKDSSQASLVNEPNAGSLLGDDQKVDFGLLRQVPMTVQVEVGRTQMTLGEILDDLEVGSSLRLDRHPGDPVDVFVNGALFARAEIVVMQDQIGAKIVELIESPTAQRRSGLR